MPRLRTLSSNLTILSILLILPAGVWAQAPDAADQSELIRQLLQRIDRLEKRVNELEATRPAAAVVSGTPAVAAV
ncbi:MAG: hypothetical protein JWO80_373, partial [Bryobacterales bacterium]|nr:hypothetical protein [Bryobacterales bacterium]